MMTMCPQTHTHTHTHTHTPWHFHPPADRENVRNLQIQLFMHDCPSCRTGRGMHNGYVVTYQYLPYSPPCLPFHLSCRTGIAALPFIVKDQLLYQRYDIHITVMVTFNFYTIQSTLICNKFSHLDVKKKHKTNLPVFSLFDYLFANV